jgi:hypothetical protein
MDVISNEEFLIWAGARGLRLDARYEPPQTLVFDERTTIICVDLPKELERWRGTLHSVFRLLPRELVWVYRRGGAWDHLTFSGEGDGPATLREGYISMLPRLGISKGSLSLRYSPDEHALLLGTTALHILTAVRMKDDLFIVPDSAEFYLWVCHDDELILVCRDPGVAESLRSEAHSFGLLLPPSIRDHGPMPS